MGYAQSCISLARSQGTASCALLTRLGEPGVTKYIESDLVLLVPNLVQLASLVWFGWSSMGAPCNNVRVGHRERIVMMMPNEQFASAVLEAARIAIRTNRRDDAEKLLSVIDPDNELVSRNLRRWYESIRAKLL